MPLHRLVTVHCILGLELIGVETTRGLSRPSRTRLAPRRVVVVVVLVVLEAAVDVARVASSCFFFFVARSVAFVVVCFEIVDFVVGRHKRFTRRRRRGSAGHADFFRYLQLVRIGEHSGGQIGVLEVPVDLDAGKVARQVDELADAGEHALGRHHRRRVGGHHPHRRLVGRCLERRVVFV